MKFHLGTHLPRWMETAAPGPWFVSAIRLRIRPPRSPTVGEWALDSGGFTELNRHGVWSIGPRQYAAEVKEWGERFGPPAWAAVQDWMCEDVVLKRTGLTVAEHQLRTLRSWMDLKDIAPNLPWVPVLQGYEYDDYLRHLDMYDAAGVDLRALPLVGLGTVCRRQDTKVAEELVRELHRIIRRPIQLYLI